MGSRKFVLSVLLILLSCMATAQQEAWLKTITGNAIESSGKLYTYLNASPGYALYFSYADNIREPYLVYVPKSYNRAHPTSLVVFLHGAILARDSFQYKDPAIADEPIFSIGDTFNTIVLFPFARADLKWAGNSPVYRTIIMMIHQAIERYNIDKKRIFIGGISMGGIATYWYVNHHPEIFAGFYTFSAMPKLGDEAIKFENITKGKPLYSMNAKDDPGFSYTEVHTIYEQHKDEAKGWHFETVEKGGHRFIYNSDGRQYVKSLLGMLLKP